MTKKKEAKSNQTVSKSGTNGDDPRADTIYYEAMKDHLSCDLNGESVILSVATGKYHGVNSVGSFIWNLVQNPVKFEEITEALLNEFDVDEEVCRKEVHEFLKNMKEKELIKVSDV